MTSVEVLRKAKTIAIAGLSHKLDRPSYSVALQLQHRGYRIVPVNPTLVEWNGLTVYPTVSSIPAEIDIDVVDIFRRSADTPEIVRDALNRSPKPRCIWLQSGIVNPESRRLAEEAGVFYVEDECTAVVAAFV